MVYSNSNEPEKAIDEIEALIGEKTYLYPDVVSPITVSCF